jgi:uncharacterized membrane protein YphA (DoxX/SURF4 family)
LRLALPGWKSAVGTVSAVVIALLFIVSGTWKVTDPLTASTLMTQALVPGVLAMPFAILLGVSETFGGVLLLVPSLRRWGAIIVILLLVAFLAYFAIFYGALHGKECNCFPWIKRSVGPAFFIGDAIMLLLAVAAWVWARRSEGLRNAAIILIAVAVFAAVSYGVNMAKQTGTMAPETITVNGQPYSLASGKVLLYFFDPECSHCDAAARQMANYNWGDTKVIGVATAQPQFGQDFMNATGLRAPLSSDLAKLRAVFSFPNAPFAVAIENGRQRAALNIFDDNEPRQKLKEIGFIH